jgi:hypothetical protein
MVPRLKRLITGWLLPLALVAGYGVSVFWPTSWWMTVQAVLVADGPLPVVMFVERDIARPFHAEWRVLVRQIAADSTQIVCTGQGSGDYRPDARLPDPLTLAWWTDGACADLEPGRYFVSTIWTIRTLGHDRLIRSESNIFEVTP